MSNIRAACKPVFELVRPKVLCNSNKPLWHNLGMAKPPVIEDKQIEHLIKATEAYSRVTLRDTALLLTLYGTALAVTELAILGHKSVSTTKRLVTQDPARLADIVAKAL
jgi:site-specific recombinase XerD